jgi:hypothetical protein
MERKVPLVERSAIGDRKRIVAVGLLTQSELDSLGNCFERAYPIDQVPCFSDLLEAIDQADKTLSREPQREREPAHG